MTTDDEIAARKRAEEESNDLVRLVDEGGEQQLYFHIERQLDGILGQVAATVPRGEPEAVSLNREGAQLANAFFNSALELIDEGLETDAALSNQVAQLSALVMACCLRLNRLDPI